MPKRWESALRMVYSCLQLSNVDVTMFFVGDAAGRMMGHATSRAKDHGDTDRYSQSPLN